MNSKKIINDAHDEVKKISYKYDEIKRSIDVYRARMSALLNSQLDLLNNVAASDKTLTQLVGVNEALKELADNGENTCGHEQSCAAIEEKVENTAVYDTEELTKQEVSADAKD